jgi:hypothetical protein
MEGNKPLDLFRKTLSRNIKPERRQYLLEAKFSEQPEDLLYELQE